MPDDVNDTGKPATRLVAVRGLGTSENDELAYVDCETHEGIVHALAFSDDIGPALCAAFLGALGHLQSKRAMRRLPTSESIPIDIAGTKVTLDRTADGRPILRLDLSTRSGVTLGFTVDVALARSLAGKLTKMTAPQTQ